MKKLFVLTVLLLTLSFSCAKSSQIDADCSKLCPSGTELNEATCECEKASCNISCDTGYAKNDETCTCEKNQEQQTTTPFVENNITYGPGFIAFEPEITASNLGMWKLREKGKEGYFPENNNYIKRDSDLAPTRDNYLEFTGNNLNGGTPKSPLVYTFKCRKSATYKLVMRMLQPLEPCSGGSHCTDNGFEKGDKRNDLWIKLEGNFSSNNQLPVSVLAANNKFWGRGQRRWGSVYKMETHVNGNKVQQVPAYNLIGGETYTLTLSGRAQGCSIDYVLFYESSLNFTVQNGTDIGTELPELYRPITSP